MSGISTHVLDNAMGRPAEDVPVRLERQDSSGEWHLLASSRTDKDGRCMNLLPDNEALTPGLYRLTFDTAAYYLSQGTHGFYPLVQITFCARDGDTRFHIPLLLSPYGYTTYRGS